MFDGVLLTCEECEKVADEVARGWRIRRADDPEDPDAEPLMATYCPDCAVREFGFAPRQSRSA